MFLFRVSNFVVIFINYFVNLENFVATILQVYYEVLSDVSILDRFYNMRGVIMEI